MSFKTIITVAITCFVFSLVKSQGLIPLKNMTKVELSDNITLECRTNMQVTGRFVWYHGPVLAFYNRDDNIFNDRYKVAVTDQASRLTITNIQFEDHGVWRCQLSVGQEIYETSTRLVIKSPPKWYNVTQRKDITLRLGNSTALFCGAVGDPTPVVTWTANTGAGGIVLPGGRITEFYVGSVLNLTNVTGVYNGKYMCHASNGLKPGISEEFIVKVPSRPYVTVYLSTVRAPRNRPYQIGCVARSFPQITRLESVSWFKGTTRVQNNVNDYRYTLSTSRDGMTSVSTLTTPKVVNSVAGTYRCEFTNDRGKGSETIMLQVGAATKPDVGASTSGAPSTLAVLHLLFTSALYVVVSVKL